MAWLAGIWSQIDCPRIPCRLQNRHLCVLLLRVQTKIPGVTIAVSMSGSSFPTDVEHLNLGCVFSL